MKQEKKSFLVNKQQVSIPTLNQDGVSADILIRRKSSMLNGYFSKHWNHSEPPLSKLSAVDHIENNFSSDDLSCSTDEIVQLIQGLDVSKANGLDGISAHMLKATSNSIAPSLTKIVNLSISNGQFPTLWKVARVVPILKSSSAKNRIQAYFPLINT